MKKITLLVVASFILVGSMAYASENPVFSDNTNRRGYYIDFSDYFLPRIELLFENFFRY
ncbi:MAG: hypothetical protein ACKO8L_04515 [Flavobacterium sp.]